MEKVIIGEVDENGNNNPYKLTFVYITGFYNAIQSKMHKQFKKLPSFTSAVTCGELTIWSENDTINKPTSVLWVQSIYLTSMSL